MDQQSISYYGEDLGPRSLDFVPSAPSFWRASVQLIFPYAQISAEYNGRKSTPSRERQTLAAQIGFRKVWLPVLFLKKILSYSHASQAVRLIPLSLNKRTWDLHFKFSLGIFSSFLNRNWKQLNITKGFSNLSHLIHPAGRFKRCDCVSNSKNWAELN